MGHMRARGIDVSPDGSIVILPWSHVRRFHSDLLQPLIFEADVLARLTVAIETIRRIEGDLESAAMSFAQMLDVDDDDAKFRVNQIEMLAEHKTSPGRERVIALRFLDTVKMRLKELQETGTFSGIDDEQEGP
jgi:hypothetical protein